MKLRSIAILSLLLGLALAAILALALAASAQGPEQVFRVQPVDSQSGLQRGQYPRDTMPLYAPTSTGKSTAQEPSASLVGFGQPGLSFRYVETFGITGEPYPADTSHLNGPGGLYIDATGSLYVVEHMGHRLLKYDAGGLNTLVIGHAGQPWHHDDFLSWPTDVAVDSGGNIWVLISPAVKEFDSSGNLVQIFPEENPWESGDANDRFNAPEGLAFDTSGRLYVSDTGNHRIQVYDVSGPAPVYSATIGVTGVPGDDNAHFDRPTQIAFDSSGRLYVVDTANYRVQRCEFSGGWSCTVFFGQTGEWGDDLTHLGLAGGITIDASDSIYVADGGNYRVLRCNTAGTCSHFAGTTGEHGWDNAHFRWPAGVAVQPGGTVYVSDSDNHRIQKFNSTGGYLGTVGVTRAPYVVDAERLNAPWGVAVVPDGSMYVTEHRGYRLVKYDTAGNQQWAIGQAGVYGGDTAHFGDWWAGPEGNPAIDASGNVYVADTGNNRIQIFAPNGAYLATFGSGGSGDYEFACPRGIAISPVNGDILVLDGCNQRIQVYTSDRIYKATLGVTGEPGDDALHFSEPRGLAVDASNNIYVADSDNQRVQKCTLSGTSYNCTTFAGETGVFDSDFGHLHPLAVAVDAAGRVSVVDEWNNRVQVFDASGAYLTTIGGGWGSTNGELIGPASIALDDVGNVYVADRDNHRIQKFAPGVPGWRQVNINGFGDRWAEWATVLEVFNGQLYAAAGNWGSGARIWRTADGSTWDAVTEPGFGTVYTNTNPIIPDMIVFDGELYAGTGWDGAAGQVWRSSDGSMWQVVTIDGFGDDNNWAVSNFSIFDNMLYAGTGNDNGAQIWRSDSGNSGSWVQVATDGLGSTDANQVTGFAVFQGMLYAAIESKQEGDAQIWRTDNGTDWVPIITDGFGDPNNLATGGFAEIDGFLYIGTLNGTTGGQIWRTSDGTTWEKTTADGFGNADNFCMQPLFSYEDALYAIAFNEGIGMQVWRSRDGQSWERISADGFGDRNNYAALWSVGMTVWNGRLYVGTWNWTNGAEVWKKTVTADFIANPTSGQPSLTVVFTNTSGGDYTTSLWDFGDGKSSTEPNPTHVYTSGGLYTVTLTVGDGVDTSTFSRSNYIRAQYNVYLPVVLRGYGVLWFESFEDGVADGWTEDVGTWQIVDDGTGNHIYRGTGPMNYPQTWLNEDWTNYALEARVRIRNGGVFICTRSNYGASFYNAYLPSDWMVSLAKYSGGNYDVYMDTPYRTFPDIWYLVRVEVRGAEYRLYLNGVLVAQHVDTASPLLHGGIGFYMGGGDMIEFDDIRVLSLK